MRRAHQALWKPTNLPTHPHKSLMQHWADQGPWLQFPQLEKPDPQVKLFKRSLTIILLLSLSDPRAPSQAAFPSVPQAFSFMVLDSVYLAVRHKKPLNRLKSYKFSSLSYLRYQKLEDRLRSHIRPETNTLNPQGLPSVA